MSTYTHSISETSLIGYALLEVLFDDGGNAEDFLFKEVNLTFEAIVGLSKGEIIGFSCKQVLDGSSTNGSVGLELFVQIAADGGQTVVDFYVDRLDKWYKVYGSSPNKGILSCLFLEVTDCQRNLQVLQEESKVIRNYLDTTEAIMVSLDREGKIGMINRYGLAFLGYDADQLVGKNWFETVLPQPEGKTLVLPVFQKILNRELDSVKEFENEVVTKAGERRTIAWRNSYQLDENGNITGALSSGIDITERNLVVEALQKSQQELKRQNLLFETLLDNLSSGVFMVEAPSGVPLLANRAARQLLGRGIMPDVTKQNLSEVYKAHKPDSTDSYPVEEMPIVRGMQGEATHIDDMIVELPDGTSLWLEVFGSPIRDDEGKVFASLVNFRDISERKQFERTIVEKENKYRTLFENLSQGVFCQGVDGKIVDVNAAALKMFGITRNQFLGKDSFDVRWKVIGKNHEFLPPEQHPSMVALRSGKPVFKQMVGVFIPERGLYHWLMVDAIPQFRPGEATPYQVFASMQDVTEAHHNQLIDECRLRLLIFSENHTLAELLEETLNEAEKLTESQIGFYHFIDDDQVTIHLQNWSTRTKAVYCKAEGFGQIYSLSQAGVWADCVRERRSVIHSDYASLPHRKGLPEGHASLQRELVVPVMRANKITAILGVGNKPIDYSQQDVEIVEKLADLAWDIAEQKLSAEALQRSEAKLKELNAQKDKFFSIIAHDLRSPFNSLFGFSDILVEQLRDKDYDGVEEYALIIQKSVKRVMDLLTDLLDWARSQTGGMAFLPEYFEIVELIDELIGLSRDNATAKNIRIDKISPNALAVFADKQRISAVIRNLVSNAIKFTPRGGNISIAVERLKNDIKVVVSDNGIGMSQERIQKLFKIDQSESTLGTNGERGTGLGLLLCNEFVLAHGGCIWAESTEGVGSDFVFTLPIKHFD